MDEVSLHASYAPRAIGTVDLPADAVHVWAVPLHGTGEAQAALLAPAERQRAARFQFLDHRRRYTISHGVLRALLAAYTGRAPQAIEFTPGPRGKPALAGADGLQFNLSHSAQLAMIAIARAPVGIDCEKVRHLESLGDIARRHFSAAEFAALEAFGGEAQLRAFYRCWTRKEAYIKAVGAGLSLPLDVFDVAIGDEAAFLAFRDGGQDPAAWSLRDVSPAADYVAALALPLPQCQVHTFACAMA